MEGESPKPKLKPTPVNWRVVLVSFTILVRIGGLFDRLRPKRVITQSATATTVTMVFPFLPWMVRVSREATGVDFRSENVLRT